MIYDRSLTDFLKSMIHKNGWLDLPAEGDSMFPLIKKEDICRFFPFDPYSLKRGDIILFWNQKGQLVAHRFYKMDRQQFYIFKGDTNLGYDEPVQQDRILGKLDSIRKNRRTVTVKGLSAYIWGELILSFPALSGLLRTYLNWKK